jgi:hypothetical protein
MIKNIIFKLLFTLFLISISESKSFKKINSNIVPTPEIALPENNNEPYFKDDSIPTSCDVIPSAGQEVYLQINSSYSTYITPFLFTFDGGKGQTSCFTMSNANVTLTYALKISYISVIHDFGFREWCGTPNTINTPKDPLKPEITNGISCHCPLGITDAKFSPCPTDDPVFNHSISQLTFDKKLPVSYGTPEMYFCHSLTKDGPSEGCDIASDTSTEYYFKFHSNWRFFPAFDLKPRSILEVGVNIFRIDMGIDVQTGDVSKSFTYIGNFSLSDLDSNIIQVEGREYNTKFLSAEHEKELIQDYVLTSTDGNFTDPDKLYMIKSDNFNDGSSFNPEKLCAIRKTEPGPLEYRKWDLEQKFKEVLEPKKCRPADGFINIPFPRIIDFFTPPNKMESRINLGTVDLMPGETRVLKTEVDASISFYFSPRFQVFAIGAFQDFCSITGFGFSCLPAQNDEGFPCVTSFSSNKPCRIQLYVKDSKQVVAAFDSKAGSQSYKFFLNRIYSSHNQTTLCLEQGQSTQCKTETLYDNFTTPYVPSNFNGVNNDTDDGRGGNIFTRHDGTWHPWLIGVVTTISVIIFLVIIAYLLPVFVMAFKGCSKLTKKAGKSFHSFIQYAKKRNNFPELDEEENTDDKFTPLKVDF